MNLYPCLRLIVPTCSLLAAFSFSATSHAQVQNIQISAAVDITAPVNFEKADDNQLGIRSAELLFYGPLDPHFDATLGMAFHSEDGEYHAELHEAYLSSSKLLPYSRFRLGKFFLGVGRLNQIHQHDWYFVSAPKVHTAFFDEEGVMDTGGEFSILLPTSVYWDITVGVTNGYTYGHVEGPGAKPTVPTHYIHPVNFVDFGEAGALQWGLNYLGRTDSNDLQTQLYGLDFVFKRTEGKTLHFLFQSEVWMRRQSSETTEALEEVGAYFFPQWSVTEQLYAGVRFDAFSELSRKLAGTDSRKENIEYALVPTLTYKNSEFTTFRAAYTYSVQNARDEADVTEQKIEFQFISALGAHRAHSF